MKKLCLITLIIIIIFYASPAFSGGQITLPYTQNFNAAGDYSSFVWDEGTCGTEHLTSGCYSGGCFKITPPLQDSDNACALGWFTFPVSPTTLNIRLLIKVGTTFYSSARAGAEGYADKFIIVTSTGSGDRPMVMFLRCGSECDSTGIHYFSACAADDTNAIQCQCGGVGGYCGYPNGQDTFYWANGINARDYAGKWVSLEFETVMGVSNKLYISTQDGVFNDTLVATEQNSSSGVYDSIQLIGGYWNQYSVADANNYLIFDNLEIRAGGSHIGPPAGFVEGADTTPPVISGGLPTTVQKCSTAPASVTLQATTNENATCKYSTTDVVYASMAGTFSTTGTTAHSQSLSLGCGLSYTYYTRCMDGNSNANTSSTAITFSVEKKTMFRR